jgi:alpha,alpha-trehalose phosphorylase
MAQMNLRAAIESVKRQPGAAERLGVTDHEVEEWAGAADAMFVPFDEERGLHPQDQDFLEHEPWNFAKTPPEHYPLLLNYPYFELYRRQVVKQADLVLAMHWRGDAFTAEQKRENFDYYETLTVRDSSLSASTQAVMAAEVGHMTLAREYLLEAAHMDIYDLAHNTADGLHMASLAGAVIAIVAGFGGLRDFYSRLSFRPRLPDGLDRLRFAMQIRGRLLRVEVSHEEAEYSLSGKDRLRILHWNEEMTLEGGSTVALPIPPKEDVPAPKQPGGREPKLDGGAPAREPEAPSREHA